MLQDFRAYHLATEFYQICKTLRLPFFLKDQLMRASASVALNLAEASGKFSHKDQKRFYSISLGSLRECQAIFDLEKINHPKLRALADQLGATLFKLCRPSSGAIQEEAENGTTNNKPQAETPN